MRTGNQSIQNADMLVGIFHKCVLFLVVPTRPKILKLVCISDSDIGHCNSDIYRYSEIVTRDTLGTADCT